MADWEYELTDAERAELDRARTARDATATVLRELTKKLKARCIKRLHRKRDKSDAGSTN
jgi:cell division inhibitor SulA